jgi:hypothetical protein
VGAPSNGQVGQPGCSDHGGSAGFSQLGPARGVSRQADPGGMGCARRASGSAATASFGCSRRSPLMGRPGRFSGGGARADLGCADRSRRRRTRGRSDVGIASAAAARRGARARMGCTGPSATGRRTRAKLGCTRTSGACRRCSRAELGRTGTARTTGSAFGGPSARPAAARFCTRVGRGAGARCITSRRCAATRLESTGGAVLGPPEAFEPDPGRPNFGQLGCAAGRGPGADRRTGVE